MYNTMFQSYIPTNYDRYILRQIIDTWIRQDNFKREDLEKYCK